MKNLLLFISTILCLTACSTYKSISNPSHLKTKYQRFIQKKGQSNGDTLITIKHFKKRRTNKLIQQKEAICINKDTIFHEVEEWIAYGRISPNAKQEINRTTRLYLKEELTLEVIEKLSLLLFSSSHTTKIRQKDKNGKMKETIIKGPYDLSKNGLNGIK